ncbi:MAG TPA: DsbA family protein, partial [Candidatus Enterococcus stercoravium]|nr:DsbA family protein [Candidatus Enterococcus stercoravium]
MIEIYLFVNPLGSVCLETETNLLDFMTSSQKKIQFRIMPLVNMQTIHDTMKRRGLSLTDIDARNRLFADTYSAALDIKTIQLQGKKLARNFMMRLQQTVGCEAQPYNQTLVEELVTEVGGDLAMFKEDRPTSFVKEMFQVDQDIAREMNITMHPSAVVYNYACERDYGVSLEGPLAIADLPKLCHTDEESYQIFHIDGYLKKRHESRVA